MLTVLRSAKKKAPAKVLAKTLVLGMCLMAAGYTQAATLRESPHLRIRILQNGRQMPLHVQPNGTVRVSLARKPFEINYPKGILVGCASMHKAIYAKAKIGTDIIRDFNSCMLEFKSVVMSRTATYLPLSMEFGFALDRPHGAKVISAKRDAYRVTSVCSDKKNAPAIPLAEVHKDLYLVLWMDNNRNKIVDAGELERWELRFR